MATELRKNDEVGKLDFIKGLRVGIAVAEWNSGITGAMCDGALGWFKSEGYVEIAIDVHKLPGALESNYAERQMIK